MATSRDPDGDDEPIEAELVGPDERTPERSSAGRELELPVVARLVIEIRSDGSRTVARGAMEDVASGQTVAVEARGSSPLALAMSLARSMVRVPALARTAARALLPGRRRRGE